MDEQETLKSALLFLLALKRQLNNLVNIRVFSFPFPFFFYRNIQNGNSLIYYTVSVDHFKLVLCLHKVLCNFAFVLVGVQMQIHFMKNLSLVSM